MERKFGVKMKIKSTFNAKKFEKEMSGKCYQNIKND